MTACLADNIEAVELIVQIVLGQKDIKIQSVRIQEVLKNLQGRSVYWISMQSQAIIRR